MRTVSDFRAFFNTKNQGAAETGAAQGYWLIQHANPETKVVVIKRPVHECVQAILDIDVSGIAVYDKDLLTKHFQYGERMLDKISRLPGCLTIAYKDLDKQEVCKSIFEHCLPYEFDPAHWESLKDENIQVSLKEHLIYYYQHKDEINMFKKECKKELLRLRRSEPDHPVWKDN